jgi:hypothetical protein
MQPLDVVGVRVEMPSNQPIVLLRETAGERYLPIWIGAVEATAIAFAQQGVVPPRPLTHDLLRDVLEAFGRELNEVRITDLDDGVFFATHRDPGRGRRRGREVPRVPRPDLTRRLRRQWWFLTLNQALKGLIGHPQGKGETLVSGHCASVLDGRSRLPYRQSNLNGVTWFGSKANPTSLTPRGGGQR